MNVPSARPAIAGRAELGLAGLLLALGGFVLVQTPRIAVPRTSNVVSARFFPAVVGVVLCVLGLWLAVDVLRGGHGEMEGGEDVDVRRASDWRTVGGVSAAFAVHVVTLERAGWPVAGALLFFGVAAALGSRRWARDAATAVALALVVWLLFARALGVGLPAGVLRGVL